MIGDYLCMISVYDGDFTNYIRDFIATIGSVFDELMDLVEGGEAVKPCETKIDAFIDWVHAHDLFQVPDLPTDLFVLQDEARGVKRKREHGLLRSLSARTHLTIASQSQFFAGRRIPRLSRFFGRASARQVRSRLVSDEFNPQRRSRQHPARLQKRPRAPSHP